MPDMPEIVNWGLLKHPSNWVTILLMVLIAGIAIHLVLDFYAINPATTASRVTP